MRFARIMTLGAALRGFALLTAVALVAGPAVGVTEAADKPASEATTMLVGEMCGGCVKRIEATLTPMDGIAKVSCDIPGKSVTVWPRSSTKLSPKALWEAMGSIGKTPKRLSGPSGTFTEKPKS
ncbi:heavy-metal-associated domain-containing protein [Alienimonas chondri]|uniref:HMA domain-containing protein n=1 Tax=Alienimonas chondri TaxID=2681879 RepID=A0ABX1V9F4_9PLAN|nr:heavy-metal-associated domain-containing protein [Alienimonas chondri]NNJ24729.1 hypothetical protein [Alienimonas chondri]